LVRLRLAARTLIEWKTPQSAQYYQQVLGDLLRFHPQASTWGLTTEKDFLRFDERGIILWFLSDTISDPVLSVASDGDRWWSVFLSENATFLLTNYALTKSGEHTWDGGPRWAQVADCMITELVQQLAPPANKSRDKRRGKKRLRLPPKTSFVLLAVMFGYEERLMRERIALLLETVRPTSRWMQTLAEIVKNGSTLVVVSQMIALIYGAARIITGPPPELLVKLFTTNGARVALSVCFATISTVAAFSSKYKVSIRKLVELLVRSKSAKIKGLKEVLKQTDLVAMLQLAIRFEGRAEPSLVKAIVTQAALRSNGQVTWILSTIPEITPEVARQSLELLADPKVPRSIQAEIIQWLCKVKVRPLEIGRGK